MPTTETSALDVRTHACTDAGMNATKTAPEDAPRDACTDARTDALFGARAPALLHLLLQHRQSVAVLSAPPAAPRSLSRGGERAPIDPVRLRQALRELPPLPQAALQALAALRDEDSSDALCAELVGRDQALVARTLRLANSPFYGMPGRVASVRQAVQLLGRQTLASLLTLATLAGQFDAAACATFSYSAFWRHALGTALAARGLSRALNRGDEPAFTAGLLHDIGRLALAVNFPAETATVLACVPAADEGPAALERRLLGIDHLDVGAQVAAQWHFPPEVLLAIAGHHAPRGQPGAAACLVDIVHVADTIAHALDLAGDAQERVPPLDEAAWARLALPQPALLAVLRETEAGVATLAQTMGL